MRNANIGFLSATVDLIASQTPLSNAVEHEVRGASSSGLSLDEWRTAQCMICHCLDPTLRGYGPMPLFLGYDPGGENKHGVAAVQIAASGTFEARPKTEVLRDAEAVRCWVHERRGDAVALGIDTLLAWSRKGKRACDDALRRRYPEHGRSVISQNSLRSAMTINGILVAQCGHSLGLRLFESHPKLVFHALPKSHTANTDCARWHGELSKKPEDHEADALVAAWCASRGFFGDWRIDLYTAIEDELIFPAGPAVYPWPEPVPAA